MIKNILILTTLLTLFSCNEDPKISGSENVDIKGEFNNDKDLLKIGKWYFSNTKSGDTIKYGKFEKGHKIDIWKYKVNGDTYRIKWSTYKNEDLEIDYPKNWTVKENDRFLFYALKDTLKGYNITRIEEGKNQNAYTVLKKYIQKLHQLDLKIIDFKELTLQDSIKLYKGNFTYKSEDGLNISCITSVFEVDDKIYNSTYFNRNSSELESKDFIIEREITYSLFLEKKEFVKIPILINSRDIKIDFN